MKAISRLWILTMWLAASPAFAEGAPKDISVGEERKLFSKVLNEERTVYVNKPRSYDTGNLSYPVIVVLDGLANFHYTASMVRFLAGQQFVPEAIVVSVENTDRARDMTPPSQDPEDKQSFRTQGGAANFRAFIADELAPWLAQNYRTRPYRILVGHSFGGLFAIDTLISRPELFNAYIAISPSLQWNGQRLVRQAEEFFSERRELKAALYMTAGNEGGQLLGGARKLAGVLGEKAPIGFEWQFDHMPMETHGSVPLRSTHQGLEFIFADWVVRNPLEIYNRYGIEGVDRIYKRRNEKFWADAGAGSDGIVSYIVRPLLQQERVDEVADLLARFGGNVKPPARFLEEVGNVYRRQGKPDRAADFYRQALAADSKHERARKAVAEMGL
jgi:predicted alpha/beta superfamily hydrolase